MLNLFGLKGNWIRMFGYFMAGVLGVCVIISLIFDFGVALGVFIAGIAVAFFACIVLQSRIPSRRLDKYPLRDKTNIRVVRKTALYKILRESGK